MSASKIFFDTNVLLYMHRSADPRKQMRAQEVFEQFGQAGCILLSTQAVQEFFAAAVRPLSLPGELRQVANALLELPLVIVGPEHIRRAMLDQERFGISFWNALILAAAEAGGAEAFCTEDLNDGQACGSGDCTKSVPKRAFRVGTLYPGQQRAKPTSLHVKMVANHRGATGYFPHAGGRH